MTTNKVSTQQPNKALFFLKMLLALLLFMFAIDLLTVSMLQLNNELAKEIFQATNNPFVGLFIGLLMTALIQSSSTVTAMIVAVVASGNLSLMQAVPLVMGANIGTTITSTLVSFSFIMKKGEFKKALSAGVLHDVFNIITVIILFPLEFYFGFLSSSAMYITNTFFDSNNDFEGQYKYNVLFTRPLSLWVVDFLRLPIVALIFSVLLVFGAIKLLSVTVFRSFVSDNYKKVSKHIFKSPFVAFIYGVFFTAAVQSSTVTTSLIVPAVANRKISLIKVFPFIIGANIGTTITAVIAAIYKTEAAISIAIVHVLFNFIGALVFMPISSVRNIPVKIATFLGKESVKTRVVGFAYILLTFFIIPFLLIYFNKNEDMATSQANQKKINQTETPTEN
ncbi:solute carrier family 34 (sodium-dependent phosphate cotransporter) [Belliella buryatensis]|uniref:Solute carrier family 34 (Sodium-dependent phosphate cotransporter) n=1 Tax=Belliella buryatensis TaxID=1500549 RepID=A0A239FTT0_9BACT|nr:Na/Pi symporter [Belliella buryatensis]SNS60195.1 solute carrier family 34 (sodium-dependent phosphate cotransporter) [Belliella buryatensis]